MRYFATRLNGDGTESLIADYLPLTEVTIVRTLSGVNSFSATLSPETPDLVGADGLPVILPWSSAIYVEDQGELIHGALVSSLKVQGHSLSITAVGLLGYLSGTPWTDAPMKYYATDPADVLRDIWTKVQAHPGANIGIRVDTDTTTATIGRRDVTPTKAPAPTKSTKTSSTSTATITTTTTTETTLYKDRNVIRTVVTRVVKNKSTGRPSTTRTETTKTTYATKRVVTVTKTFVSGTLKDTKTTTSTLSSTAKVLLLTENVTKDEPFVLAPYSTTDLGQTFAEVASVGSIDYIERHEWDGDGISHHIDLGFPRLGRRRSDIIFDTGVNVTQVPEVDLDVDDYASSVLILAAGEGDKMVRATAETDSPPRLRRVRAIESKGIGRQATADKAAADALKQFGSTFPLDVSQLVIQDSPLAPMGTWELGDEVRLTGHAGWAGNLDLYVRIMEESWDPESSTRTLTVTRADRV